MIFQSVQIIKYCKNQRENDEKNSIAPDPFNQRNGSDADQIVISFFIRFEQNLRPKDQAHFKLVNLAEKTNVFFRKRKHPTTIFLPTFLL